MPDKICFLLLSAISVVCSKLLVVTCKCYVPFFFREFIEHDLLEFCSNNPGVVVYLKPRRFRPPGFRAEYCKCNKYVVLRQIFDAFVHLFENRS